MSRAGATGPSLDGSEADGSVVDADVARYVGGDSALRWWLLRQSRSSALHAYVLTQCFAERSGLATNLYLSPEVLAVLAGDPEPVVRQLVAQREGLPPEAILTLAQDPTETVRWNLAHNESLTQEAQELLSRDSEDIVLSALVSNLALVVTPRLTVEVLEALPAGRELIKNTLARFDADSQVLALRFTGTLEELVRVLEEL